MSAERLDADELTLTPESWRAAGGDPYSKKYDQAKRTPTANLAVFRDDRTRVSDELLFLLSTKQLNDAGNAARFVELHGQDVRFCYAWNRWAAWAGTHWNALDAEPEIVRKAKETARLIYSEVLVCADDDERRRHSTHAQRSNSERAIRAMLALAKPELSAKPEQFDSNTSILPMANGTLNLDNCLLQEHRREDFCTMVLPVAYDPEAKAPRFRAFLAEIFDDDEDVILFVQRLIGYCLSGDTSERILTIGHGDGSNGKSLLAKLLLKVFGPYGATTPTDTLMSKRGTDIPNDVARLVGKRIVVVNETQVNRTLAEGTVKALTGDDKVVARFMRAEWFEFRPAFKLWLMTNNRPRIRDTSNAIWDRVALIPFNVRFVDEPDTGSRKKDPELEAKLTRELPGILAWAVDGLRSYLVERALNPTGLPKPPAVRAAIADYRAAEDVLTQFIQDACELVPEGFTPTDELLAAFNAWAKKSGEKEINKNRLVGELRKRFQHSERNAASGYRRGFFGIGLAKDGRP